MTPEHQQKRLAAMHIKEGLDSLSRPVLFIPLQSADQVPRYALVRPQQWHQYLAEGGNPHWRYNATKDGHGFVKVVKDGRSITVVRLLAKVDSSEQVTYIDSDRLNLCDDNLFVQREYRKQRGAVAQDGPLAAKRAAGQKGKRAH